MRFLCVSDQIDPFIYSTTVRERYEDVDAVFSAGDLDMEYVDYIVTTMGKPTFFVFGNHNLKDFNYYDKKLKKMGRTPRDALSEMNHGHGGDYAGNEVIRSKYLNFTLKDGKTTPLLICGVSGSKRYNNGLAQYTEGEMLKQLKAMVPQLKKNKRKYGRYCDIFLTHASPRHVHDKEDPCHQGFECFNWFIEQFEPALMIHGHIHLYDLAAERVSVVGKTTVVNAYSHVIIDMNEKKDLAEGENIGFDISVITNR
jgi:Icc-related predicted phosphoesterase